VIEAYPWHLLKPSGDQKTGSKDQQELQSHRNLWDQAARTTCSSSSLLSILSKSLKPV
jgi:hypothetical protein